MGIAGSCGRNMLINMYDDTLLGIGEDTIRLELPEAVVLFHTQEP